MWEDNRKEIIENTDKSKIKFGYRFGGFDIKLTKEDIEALIEGKCVATTINCEEYSIFIYKK